MGFWTWTLVLDAGPPKLTPAPAPATVATPPAASGVYPELEEEACGASGAGAGAAVPL